MKILQISPQFPYPLDSGGKIGIYNIIKQLSEFGAEIYLAAYSKDFVPEEFIKHFASFCHPYVIYENTANTLPRVAYYFYKNKPIYTEKYFTKKSQDFFCKLLQEITFDIIHLDHTAMYSIGKWISEKSKVPFGLRLHNIEWLIWQRYLDEQPNLSFKRIFFKQQTNLLRGKEKEAINNAIVSFVCTEEDRARALELVPDANVLVASPGVDLNFWVIDNKIERNRYEIVLATTYDWKPNVDGLKWYLNNVHPLILEKEPKAFLTILGKNPPKFCRNYPNVKVVGYVDKVQPYYNRSNLFIVPLFVASGVRMRIYEAMSMGLPVVSTSIGAEGIDAEEENGLFIANSPREFAEKVLFLIENPDVSKMLGGKTRKYIETNYSVKKTIRIIYDTYSKILSEA